MSRAMNGTDSASNTGLQATDWIGLLVPGVMVLVIGIFMIVALALAVHRKSLVWGIVTGVSSIALLASLVTAGISFLSVFKKDAVGRSGSWIAASENGEHRLEVPGHWKEETGLADDPAIQVANRFREQYLLVGEDRRDGSVPLDEWATAMNTAMSSKIANVEVSPLEDRKVGKFPARYSRIAGAVDGVKISYHATYLEVPEKFVYVLCWTLKEREKTAFPVFDRVVRSYTYTPTEALAEIHYDKSAPISERVPVLIANALGVSLERVTPEAEIGALGADELDIVELVMTLEEEFGGEISDEVAAKLVTVADLTRWAEAQAKAPASEAAPVER